MVRIIDSLRLEQVEHILGSGTGTLDFAVDGEDEYYTWNGVEDAEWEIEGVDSVKNDEEDRFMISPEGEYFICDIQATGEEENQGPVRCWSE